MARQKDSRSGRCQGCNHLERVRIERLLAAGASIKAAARKFAIDYHALRRHWRPPTARYPTPSSSIIDLRRQPSAKPSVALRPARGDS